MNKVNGFWLLTLLAPALAAARDPFLPAPDPCVHPFAHAQYRGWVTAGSRSLALVEVAPGRWQHWMIAGQVAEGWQVSELNRHQLVISGPESCQPMVLFLSQQGAARDETYQSINPDAGGTTSAER